jgi:Histidine kinase-, DNA gyrase B-, and HSP90-like ATPase
MATKEWENFDLSVAAKVIQHLSSGIYRTPGGAIKELVSNSFDAQASWVSIDTRSPGHRSFVVEDDGIGMDEALIRRSFSHIGASVKASDAGLYPSDPDRPIIGRFGIGVLAAAHVSHQIKFTTYPKGSDHGLECELDLEPFFDLVNAVKTLEEVALGTVRFREIPRDGHSPGTIVELQKIEEGSNFHRTISRPGKYRFVASWPKGSNRKADGGKAMGDFIRAFHNKGLPSIDRLNGREKLLWELGLICPVKYLASGPVAPEFLAGRAKQIVESLVSEADKSSFTVFFDGIEVRKPILLPTPKARESYVDREDPSLSKNVDVYPIDVKGSNSKVRARGYLVHQPHVVQPREIQGLYPRIRGVGVGQYENTLFRALRGETPIIRVRLSGEIYLDGLDDAINLDRSGFNELSKEFQRLLDGLENALSIPGAILSEVKRRTDEQSGRVKEVKSKHRAREAQETLQKQVRKAGSKFKVRPRASAPERPSAEQKRGAIRYPFVTIVDDEGAIEVDPDEKDPRLPRMIVEVDRFLSELPNGEVLRRDLAKRLLELFG